MSTRCSEPWFVHLKDKGSFDISRTDVILVCDCVVFPCLDGLWLCLHLPLVETHGIYVMCNE